MKQALELQKRAYEEAMKPGTKARDVAQLTRAWDVLEDRKRVLRGRPLPGSFKPEKPKGKAMGRGGMVPNFVEAV